jgi:GAF domain-containing protein
MLPVDEVLLRDPLRLEAVDKAHQLMASLPVLLDEVAATAARCLVAPMAVVSLVGEEEEFLAGVYDVSGGLVGHRHRSTTHWAGQYVVSADRPVRSPDIFAEEDSTLRCHPLLPRRAVRALLSVPLTGDGGRTVGCLTVADVKTRQWSDEQGAQLGAVASLLHPHVLATARPATS